MNKIEGITTEETKLLQAVLLFCRSAKPKEVCELKLSVDKTMIVKVRSEYLQAFDI